MTSIKDLFEESTTKAVEEISEDSIKDLSELCQKLLRVEAEVGNTEERLKRLKDQQRELSEQLIPDRLTQLGVSDLKFCLLYTSPSPRDGLLSRMPSSA